MIAIAVCVPPGAAAAPADDRDRDGLSDWTETKRTKTNPNHRDTDRDRLGDWTEVRRTKTNPRRRDTDGDGLSDWTEVRRTKTDPLRAGGVLGLQLEPPSPIPDPAPAPSPAPLPDTTPPETWIDAAPPALAASATASFEFSGLDPPGAAISSFECRLDGGSWASCASPRQHAALADGQHRFEVRSRDAAANADPSPASHSWSIDTVPPTLSIDSGPDGVTNDPTPSFGFSAEPGTTPACSIDTGTPSFGPCSGASTHTPASPLGEGDQTFRLRVTDAAGNQATARRDFHVDTAAPSAPQLTATLPASPADDNAPEVVGSADAGTTVRLYGGGACSGEPLATVGAATLAAGAEVAVPGDSTTVVRATATSAAGNASGCSAPLTYVEDSTAPATQINAAPPELTTSAGASFAFSGSDPGGSGVTSFECRLDGGSWASCASPTGYAAVADGPHAFEVRAVDAAGNVDQSPALAGWQVDTLAPALSIESGPGGLTADATPSFAFSAADASFECSLDKGAASFTTCSGGAEHTPGTPLADGAWTFRVRATDAAGNQATATRAFSVDATPPETALGAKPAALVNSAAASFGFSGADAGSGVAFLECRLDSGPFVSCTSPRELSDLSEGGHSFQVRATDAAGNVDPSPAGHTWAVDLTAPQPQIESGPDGLTNDATPTFAFSAPDASYQCSVDKGTASFGACSTAGTHTPAPLADGAWTFRVRATDDAGNQATATRGFQVDTAIPAAPSLGPTVPASPANHNSPLLTGAAPAGTTIRLHLGAGCSGAPLTTVPASSLAAGIELDVDDDSTTQLSAAATSAAANTSSCSTPLTYVEDSTAPATQIGAAPPALIKATTASFSFAGSDTGGSGVASFECKLDGGSFASCASPREHTGLGEGSHTFQVRATDKAGNVDATPASHSWTVDTTPPALSIEGGPDGLTNDSTPTFSFSAPGAAFECSVDKGTASFGACSTAGTHTPAALADGGWTFRVRATDAAGNQATATRGFQVDTAAPSAPALTSTTPASPANHNAPRLSGSAPTGTAIRLYTGGACSGTPLATVSRDALAAGIEVAVGDDTTTVFRATATTAAGNTSGCSEPRTYLEDSTPPQTQIGTKPAALVNSTAAELSFSGLDPGGSGAASFECRLDDASFASCASPRQYTSLAEGPHTFEVRAIDGAGNADATSAAHSWTIDLTPPAVQIDGGPEGFTADTTPTFGFSSPGSGFQCSVDKGTASFAACSGSGAHTPVALADGSWTFRVRATDAAGNQATATRGFSVDATAPDTQLTAQPATLTNATAATFSFSGSDAGSGVASFQCKLDAGSFNACTSPHQLSGLAEGSHSFQVRTLDQVGNVDASPASYSWQVDLTPPTVQIASGPDGPTSDTTPTVTFNATAGATRECSVDQGTPSFGPCSATGSHTPATPLGDGGWTFRVRATDAAGNQATATRAVEVDTVAPETLIDTKPAALVNSTTASFSFTGSDPGSGLASLRCKLDNESFAVCTSPREYTGLTEGSHSFQVRAFDVAGNVDESPATHTWTVDLTPPAVQIDSGPTGFTGDTTPTFAFSASGAGFQCSVDKGTPSFSVCSAAGTHTPAALADGGWTFRVRATDAAGNQAMATRDFSVDATAPETSIGAKPAALVNSTTASFSFSGSDSGGSGVASFQCKLDAGAFTVCTSPREYSGLGEGGHTVQVRTVDQVGNIDASAATYEWTVDLTPPAVQIDSGPTGFTGDTTPTFAFSAPGASFECSLDSGTPSFGPCSASGSHTPASPLPDGAHSFRVRATDAAGNQTTTTRSFSVDATSPDTSIGTKPATLVNTTAASFSFSGSDPGGSGVASFECKLDGGAFAPCTSPREYGGLAEGSRGFQVRAVDAAGNADASPATHAWEIDTTPPALAIESGPDGLTTDSTPTFTFSAPGATFQCSLDKGTPSFAACSGPGTHTPASPLADGGWTFRVRAADAATNQATATRGFTLDTSAPPAPELTTTLPPSPANENAPRIAGSAAAGTTVRLYNGGTCGGSPLATVTTAALAAGIEVAVADDTTTVFRATATTAAGIPSGCSEQIAYLEDSTAPDTAITAQPPALTNSATATFAVDGSDPGGSGVTSFECKLDAQPFAPCTSGIELVGLGQGAHSFTVRAVDAAGNADANPATHSWQVDLSAPQVTIDSLSKTLVRAMTSSNVTWHADENGAFELRAGGADCATGTAIATGTYGTQPATRVSTVTGAQLAEGANTLRLCLADAAGNRGAATATLTKDSISPETTITLGPAALVNSTAASLSFSGSDPGGSGVASFRCRIDGDSFTTCTSPRSYSGLSEGLHVFEVRATDLAGNSDESTDEREWRIDLTPPALSIEAGPDGLTNDPTPTFRFSSAEPDVAFECSIDGGTPSFGPCSASGAHTPASPLPDGAHSFRVRATDAAGNQGTATRGFTVDSTAPPAPQLSPTTPASPANDNQPRISGTAAADASVRLYAGPCSGAPLATLTPAELEAGVEVAVADDTTTVFRATATMPGEAISGCSEPLLYVEDSSPPQTTIAAAPPATTASTSATFGLAASEPGARMECSLDGAAFTPCASPRSHANLATGPHSFAVRATDAAGNLDQSPAETSWTIEPPPTEWPSACVPGNTEATTAAAVRAAVAAGSDVCVTADVGNVDLGDLGAQPVVVSTAGGSMGAIDLGSTTDLTLSLARFRSVTIRNSHRVRLLGNTIGGTATERTSEQLIFMPETNNDVLIEGNDIGWTLADDSGNTGYGCRCYGTLNRLRFVGNRLHDLAADGFQGVGGVDVVIDRNEIGPVGRNPESDEHSDSIQITGNDANLRITNNWIHHQGYFDGEVTANAGSTYIHGDSEGTLTYENNLIETAQGRTEVCGLGTGGVERSNLTIRRNTWVDGGKAFNGFPSFEWDCDGGSGNVIARNIAIDPDGGLADNGYDAAFVAPNLFGTLGLVTLDADRNCLSANCNPASEEPIGYRKPSGVDW